MNEPIYLYADGSSRGNPGPGGYGVILKCGNHYKELSGGFSKTTNNRMELLGVISGLEALKKRDLPIKVYSDSSYVVRAINEGWLSKWLVKGLRRHKNPDLWQRYLNISKGLDIEFNWIKGHAGHPENERCDALAVAAAMQLDLKEDAGYIEVNNNNALLL
jgi:ribonuclease HI